MTQAPTLRTRRAAVHALLIGYTLIAILPVLLWRSFVDPHDEEH